MPSPFTNLDFHEGLKLAEKMGVEYYPSKISSYTDEQREAAIEAVMIERNYPCNPRAA